MHSFGIKYLNDFQPSIRSWGWVGVQFLSLGVVCLLTSFLVDQDDWIYHGAFCIVGSLLSIFRLSKYFRLNLAVFLTEHRVMLLISFTFYYLIGGSMLAFGSDYDINQSMTLMEIGAPQALVIDAINSMGFGIALIVSSLSSPYWLPKIIHNIGGKARNLQSLKIIIILMVVGGAARFHVVSNDFFSDTQVISGIWRVVDKSIIFGVFFALMYQGTYQKSVRLLGFLVGVFLSVLGLLCLSKQEFALPLIAMLGGVALRTNSRFIILIGGALLYVTMSVVAEPIQFGRSNLDSLLNKLSLSERVKLIENGFYALKDIEVYERYSMWSRISYVTAQAAAVNFYNNGNGDDEYLVLPWVFVPRFLVDDKPLIGTNSGKELHYKIRGFTGSSLGVGAFVDGYYNLGWFGFIFSSAMVGWIVSQTSAIAKEIYKRRFMLMYPIMFSGLFMAFRIDGTLVGDYLGKFVMISYALIGLALINYLMGSSRRREDNSSKLG